MNRVTLLGRITQTPQLKRTDQSAPYVSFTLAVTRRFKNAKGEYYADFLRCVAWGKTAEFIAKNFDKGLRIALEGSLRSNTWKDGEGKHHYSTDVYVESVYFADQKVSRPSEDLPAVESVADTWNNFDENELPFE